MVRAKIENVTLEMMINIGSGLSILSSDIYFKYIQQFKLSNKGVKLKPYQILESLGEILVKVTVQGISKSCYIPVSKVVRKYC